MKKPVIFISILLSIAMWQCSKEDNDGRGLSFKESLGRNIDEINQVSEKISGTKGYQLILASGEDTKSDYTFRDSIKLNLIAGIYDYQPDTVPGQNNFFPYRLFKKTGQADNLIVNLPEKIVFHPRNLHFFTNGYKPLVNNFKITATDYHFYYDTWYNFDYKLNARFTLDTKDIGALDIVSAAMPGSGSTSSSEFSFPGGYSIIRSGFTGDTTGSAFALMKDEEPLLKETVLFYGEGFKRKEKQYILTIGNIELKRTTGIDSVQVFLDGVLQSTAGAKIVENDDYNASICFKRDILITFDDGTSVKLSELLDPARETLKTLVRSLGEMYLSKQIVDFIALSIYFHSR